MEKVPRASLGNKIRNKHLLLVDLRSFESMCQLYNYMNARTHGFPAEHFPKHHPASTNRFRFKWLKNRLDSSHCSPCTDCITGPGVY